MMSSTPARRPPRSIITPKRTWLPTSLSEVWEFRSLLARFAARDITLRYRQTALGVTWVILQPLLAAGILAFVFGSVADLPSPPGVPYFVFSLVGLVGWTAFSQISIRSSSSLVSNAALVTKVFFPRLLLPLSTVASTLVDVGVSIVLLAGLLIANDINAGWPLLLAPFWLMLLIAAALGVGLLAGALMVRYRDVTYVLPVAIQFLLYASPVAYSYSAVPEKAQWLYRLNPLTALFEGLRWSALGTARPSTSLIAYSVAAVLAGLLVGLVAFGRMERQFADVI